MTSLRMHATAAYGHLPWHLHPGSDQQSETAFAWIADEVTAHDFQLIENLEVPAATTLTRCVLAESSRIALYARPVHALLLMQPSRHGNSVS